MSSQFIKLIVLSGLLAARIHAATSSTNTTFNLSFNVNAENQPLATGLEGFILTCNNCTVSGKLEAIQGSVDGPGVENFVSGGFLDVFLSDFSSTISLDYSLAPGVSVSDSLSNTVPPIPLPGGSSAIQNLTIPGFGTMDAFVRLSVIPSVRRMATYPPMPVTGDLNFTTGFQSTAGTTIENYLNLTNNFEHLHQTQAAPSYTTGFNQIQGNALEFNAAHLIPQDLSVSTVLQANISIFFNTNDNGGFGTVTLVLLLGELGFGTLHIPDAGTDCQVVIDHTAENSFPDALQVEPTFSVQSYAGGFKQIPGGFIDNAYVGLFESTTNLPLQCLIPNGNTTGLVPVTQARLDALSNAAVSFRAYSGTLFSLVFVWSIAWML